MVRKSQTNRGSRERSIRKDDAEKMLGDRPVLKVPVEFGGVNFGKTKATVVIKIARSKIKDEDINEYLVNCRMDITMAVDPNAEDDVPGQEFIFDTAECKISSIADVHRASIGSGDVSARLSFSKESINDGELARFSNQSGMIVIARIGEAGNNSTGDAGIDGDDDQGTLGEDAE